MGKFISADTLIPHPTNPQSFNRYSYTRNNPINFVDPSGHRECSDDCSTPLPHEIIQPLPFIPTGPMVTFSGCETCTWSEAEMATIQASAMATGTRWAETLNAAHAGWNLSAQDAFLLVYDGSVNFHKTGQSCLEATGYSGCWGRSTGRNSIEVFTDIVNKHGHNQLIGDTHWAVHELGHSFVSAVGGFNVPGFSNSFTIPSAIELLQTFGLLPDRPPGSDRQSTWGFAGGRWEWQRSSSGAASEEFADMYLGWVYNQWETTGGTGTPLTEAGSMRANFMYNLMPYVANLVITR